MSKEEINHPTHYSCGDPAYEVVTILENWDLGFHLGNVVKYIFRHDKKNAPEKDLRKALWYLERYINLHYGTSE